MATRYTILWLAIPIFALSAALVVAAGASLARNADRIADATGIGKVWIGSILLATATSLPELATDITAVRLGSADLAVGDLFGSTLANMLILALVDLLPPRGRVLRGAAFDNILGAALAITLNALAVVFVLLRPQWTFAGVSPESVLLLLVYVVGSRAIYYDGMRQAADAAPPLPRPPRSRKRLVHSVTRFAIAALVVLAAAPALAWSARGLAVLSGLGATFVGTLLVGLATSLPELVTSVAAVRIGALDLAVSNLFGSCAFNMIVFVALDLAHPGGAIFAAVSPAHAISGVLAVLLMSLGVAAIVYRAERRFAMLEPGSVTMVVAYLAAVALLYLKAAPH